MTQKAKLNSVISLIIDLMATTGIKISRFVFNMLKKVGLALGLGVLIARFNCWLAGERTTEKNDVDVQSGDSNMSTTSLDDVFVDVDLADCGTASSKKADENMSMVKYRHAAKVSPALALMASCYIVDPLVKQQFQTQVMHRNMDQMRRVSKQYIACLHR